MWSWIGRFDSAPTVLEKENHFGSWEIGGGCLAGDVVVSMGGPVSPISMDAAMEGPPRGCGQYMRGRMSSRRHFLVGVILSYPPSLVVGANTKHRSPRRRWGSHQSHGCASNDVYETSASVPQDPADRASNPGPS